MAIFKPVMSTGNSFFGICEINILSYKDRSNEFDWADVFIEVELSVKDSDFSNRLTILGRLDKDANGDITGGSVLKRMYNMFDMFGCKAGLNIKGVFEDEHGNIIDDMGQYLTERYTTQNLDYIAYAYKKKPKEGKKVYTEMYPKFWPNTNEGKAQCDKDITWLKEKGIIKEADASDMPQQNDNTLAASALNNL